MRIAIVSDIHSNIEALDAVLMDIAAQRADKIYCLGDLVDYGPDVVCYSMTTGMHMYYADVNRTVKKVLPNVFSVSGGPHPTFSPEFVENEGMDAVCRGEGEIAIVDLLDRMQNGQDINDCPNFWIKDRQTGEMSICEERGGQLVCKLAADERAAFQDEIDRMQEKLAGLEQRLGAVEQNPILNPQNLLPTDEQFEKSLSYMERFFRRFMDIVKDMDKGADDQQKT